MKILILDPFFSGSHKSWAEDYARFSSHEVQTLTLPGKFWKWRMHGGAVTLARRFNAGSFCPDLLLFTDMLDVSTFLALTRKRTAGIPTALYFHENQLTYPVSQRDSDLLQNRDRHYGFINFASALACDTIYFNSDFHRLSFFTTLRKVHLQYPDFRELESISMLEKRSRTLYLGLDLKKFDEIKINATHETPLLLWNHRWEYDKNPDDFFRVLDALIHRGMKFELVILGENSGNPPASIQNARAKYGSRILHIGYLKDIHDYGKWLWKADILPVTSLQDFFGISIMEAVYCNCTPVLPRRLSYPEVFADLEGDGLFYNTVSELTEILVKLLSAEELSDYSAIAARFDWEKMAPLYDQIFSDLS
ncbi:MAG: DUF3524 domain-containing protein [FCB group bacterium]|nr:DUF3524 domain-containing protein [FCB group bacterium]